MSHSIDTSILRKHLKCPLCLREYKKPRILECLHVICESCIHKLISMKNNGREITSKSFVCPLCDKKTKAMDKLTLMDTRASSFPICDTISNLLVKPDSPQKESGQHNDNVCDHCKAEGVVARPFAFCAECAEYYCKSCYESHRKFKVTRSHKVLKGADIPRDTFHFNRSFDRRVCKRHLGEKNVFKCSDHDELFCASCASSYHQSCDHIRRFDNTSHDSTKWISEFICNTEALINSIIDNVTCKLNNSEKIETRTDTIHENLVELVTGVQSLPEYLDQVVLGKIKERYSYQNDIISDSIVDSTAFIDRLNNMLEIVEIISKYGLKKHAIVMHDSLKKHMLKIEEFLRAQTKLQDSTEQLLIENVKVMLEEVINRILTKIDSTLQSMDMSTLQCMDMSPRSFISTAEVQILLQGEQNSDTARENDSTSPAQSPDNVKENDKTDNIDSIHSNKLIVNKKFHKIGKYDISIPSVSEKPAYHSASLILDDGNMVFIDVNNRVVKCVSPEFNVKFYEKFQSEPRDIAFVNDRLVVATSNGIIRYFIDVQNEKFTMMEYLETNDAPVSICAMADTFVLLHSSDQSRDFIQARDTTGKVMWSLNKLYDDFGAYRLMKNQGMVRMFDQNSYAICQERAIHRFSTDGTFQWMWVSNCTVASFCYITLDSEKNMFVCDKDANAVHQVSIPNPMHNRTIVSHIQKPTSVLFNTERNILVIGCMNDDNVHMYKFM